MVVIEIFENSDEFIINFETLKKTLGEFKPSWADSIATIAIAILRMILVILY